MLEAIPGQLLSSQSAQAEAVDNWSSPFSGTLLLRKVVEANPLATSKVEFSVAHYYSQRSNHAVLSLIFGSSGKGQGRASPPLQPRLKSLKRQDSSKSKLILLKSILQDSSL